MSSVGRNQACGQSAHYPHKLDAPAAEIGDLDGMDGHAADALGLRRPQGHKAFQRCREKDLQRI